MKGISFCAAFDPTTNKLQLLMGVEAGHMAVPLIQEFPAESPAIAAEVIKVFFETGEFPPGGKEAKT